MATANTTPKRPQGDFKLVVKTALLHRNKSVASLARELGFARNTVSIAINHTSMLPTVKTAIRKHLKLAA